jgi:hypothetical protein
VKCIQNVLGKSQGKRELGRSRRRSEGIITVDLREMACEIVG